ncbi:MULTISPECIES: fumarate reductase subunit C [Halorhodospira]|uniref:fumarate reductase subunit C n=1 Tax=Halorhodospira TaxID=85108 RepID=UPI001913EA11|nr:MULTISPECIES: fumarate reductase subunit C [Halorhodospira]MBK5937023.1 hypothetical protein [Halorhodospira halophila]MCG5540485.1 fumarate reductase subunit C [Halorhodospira sp. M39old]MCG5545019.1 fumarate reductase subunit C [Halorhodospira sp. M38]
MSRARVYRPTMRGWWERHPAYRRYLLREGSSVLLGLYALWLLAGLLALAAGEAAYQGWRDLHGSAWLFGLHLAALLAAAYHAVTWFRLLPLTLPVLRWRGRRPTDRAVVRGAWVVSVALSGGVWLYLLGGVR